MKKIDLKQLTDVDFEIFSKDILSYKLNIPIRTFKPYKDKGIDCYVLSDEKWIGQAKFFIETTDSTMISKLKKRKYKGKKIKTRRPLRCNKNTRHCK